VERVVRNALANELRLCRLIFYIWPSETMSAIVFGRLRSSYGAPREKPIHLIEGSRNFAGIPPGFPIQTQSP
jgi:hypothetical protein